METLRRWQQSPYFWPLLGTLLVAIIVYLWYRWSMTSATMSAPMGNRADSLGGGSQPAAASEEEDSRTRVTLDYAPWCQACKAVKPVWKVLMDKYSGSPQLLVDEVDCVAHPDIEKAMNITQFPTIIKSVGGQLQEFHGNRNLESLDQFIKG